MQFYIVIRDEQWEHVGKIKTAPLDTLQATKHFLRFSLFKNHQNILSLEV